MFIYFLLLVRHLETSLGCVQWTTEKKKTALFNPRRGLTLVRHETTDPYLIPASLLLQEKEEKRAWLHQHPSNPHGSLRCALYGSGCIMNLVVKCRRGLEGKALAENSLMSLFFLLSLEQPGLQIYLCLGALTQKKKKRCCICMRMC